MAVQLFSENYFVIYKSSQLYCRFLRCHIYSVLSLWTIKAGWGEGGFILSRKFEYALGMAFVAEREAVAGYATHRAALFITAHDGFVLHESMNFALVDSRHCLEALNENSAHSDPFSYKSDGIKVSLIRGRNGNVMFFRLVIL